MLDKTQLAYAAGIMDGEGTIGVYRYNARGREWFGPSVQMANTNLKIVKLFKSWFGGTISEHKSVNSRWKTVYKWELTDRAKQLAMIAEIVSYLVIKRKQAELILAFYQIPKTGKGSYHNHPEFTAEEKVKQAVLYRRTLELNGGWRGKHNAEPQRLSDDDEAFGFVSDSPGQTELNIWN